MAVSRNYFLHRKVLLLICNFALLSIFNLQTYIIRTRDYLGFTYMTCLKVFILKFYFLKQGTLWKI